MTDEKIIENKKEEKILAPQEKKKEPSVKTKKESEARGLNMPASKKHCMYLCRFIMNKTIDQAINELKKVILYKRPVSFKGEIPHRKYPNVMSGRFPIKASKQFINILKGLRGNVLVNGMDLERTRISWASANWAYRPKRSGGVRFKRSHVLLKAKEVEDKIMQNEEKLKHG